MKLIFILVALLIGTAVLMVVIGWLLPREHVATRASSYRQKPEAIWSALADVDAMPSWREELKSIRHMPDRNGLPAHVEITSMGEIPLETVACNPPRLLVRRIADPKLPYGGTWTFEITPMQGGAMLRITENGFVSNPLFRFMTRFVLGYTAQLDSYLRALAKKFGEEPKIVE
jgi:uncharacterized protein YndB with AHSA1/START domain